MFTNEDPGARDLATDSDSLQNPQEQQQNGRPDAQFGIGRQQPNSQGGQRHEKNAESEHLFATAQISRMSHYYATQRSREITGSKYAESLELPKPIRDFGREKEHTNCVREENEDNEVIKLQETSQSGKTECPIISCSQAPFRDGGNGYNIFHVSDPSVLVWMSIKLHDWNYYTSH